MFSFAVVNVMFYCFITPQPLMVVEVLFSSMVSGWVGGLAMGKVYLGCISEAVKCRKLMLDRDTGGWGGVVVQCHGGTLM